MALPKPLHEDHEVLGDDYCPGYVDAYGNWNNGFPCPSLTPLEPVHCCGTPTHMYCCTGEGPAPTHPSHNDSIGDPVVTFGFSRLPLLLGVLVGAVVAVSVVIVVSCLHCSCCLLYKKRQPSNTGPMYQLQGGTSGVTGVANMYSFSRATTPQCSLSRSGTSSSSNRHSMSSLRLPSEPPTFGPQFTHFPAPINRGQPRSDCGSLISSLSSSATPSDSATREALLSTGRLTLSPSSDVSCSLSDLPPPYSVTPRSPHQPTASSQVVAVRTLGTAAAASRAPGTLGLAAAAGRTANGSAQESSRHHVGGRSTVAEVYVIGAGDNGMLSTFTQSPGSAATTSITTSHTLYPHNHTNNSHNNTLPGNRSNNLCPSSRSSYSVNNQFSGNNNGNFYNSAGDNGSHSSCSAAGSNSYSTDTSSSNTLPASAYSASNNNYNNSSCPTPSAMYKLPPQQQLMFTPHSSLANRVLQDCHPDNVIKSSYSTSGGGATIFCHPQKTSQQYQYQQHGPSSSSFSPALTPTTRPCSTAHIIHTSHSADDDSSNNPPHEIRLLTATKF